MATFKIQEVKSTSGNVKKVNLVQCWGEFKMLQLNNSIAIPQKIKNTITADKPKELKAGTN